MTLLGFKRRFVPNVLAGYHQRIGVAVAGDGTPKRHSIRAIPKSGVCRFKVGGQVQLYTDVRQSTMHKIVDVDPVCMKIEAIEISSDVDGEAWVYVDDIGLTPAEYKALATADGFATVEAFFDFFVPQEPMTFRGHIIHWDWK